MWVLLRDRLLAPQVPGNRVPTVDGGGTMAMAPGQQQNGFYINGKWYYFQEDGYMATGWITLYNVLLSDPLKRSDVQERKDTRRALRE